MGRAARAVQVRLFEVRVDLMQAALSPSTAALREGLDQVVLRHNSWVSKDKDSGADRPACHLAAAACRLAAPVGATVVRREAYRQCRRPEVRCPHSDKLKCPRTALALQPPLRTITAKST